MCSVDRRRYRDGDFNGHWTSQLAPSQCSGTLLPPRFCPPRHSFIPFLHFSLSFAFSRFTLPFTHLSVNLSSCVSLVRFLSSSFRWPKSPIASFSSSLSLFLSLFLLPSQTPGLYATWKASGLKRDITGPSLASDTGTQKTGVLSYPRGSL